MNSPTLLLLRGLPSSGKSTLAKILSRDGKYPVFSVDDFFTNAATGEYKFEFDKNHVAYKQCQENTKAEMKKGTDLILVDNTFTLEWEIEPYVRMAAEFNYQIFVTTVEKYHNGDNIHAIPDEQIRKMGEKYKVKLF